MLGEGVALYIADMGTDSAPGWVGMMAALLLARTFEMGGILLWSVGGRGLEPPMVERPISVSGEVADSERLG